MSPLYNHRTLCLVIPKELRALLETTRMLQVLFSITIIIRVVATGVAGTAGATTGATDSSSFIHLLHRRDRVLEGLAKADLINRDH